jgi:hypothetical protein
MPTARPFYNAQVTMTWTLASLASSAGLTAGRQSTVADNTLDQAVDSIVTVKFTSGTNPTANTQFEIWAFGSSDLTPNFSGNAGASDANFTPTDKTTMKLLEIIPNLVTTSNLTYVGGPYSIQNAFGGTMPRKWGLFFVHNTGQPLNSTAGNFSGVYTPVQYQSF